MLPKDLKLNLIKNKDMRYGENPHQTSAFYIENGKPGFEQLWGIEISHNNIGDANNAWKLVCEFTNPTIAIIKHANPSGITSRDNLVEAFDLAYAADSVSAFGGIIALNCEPSLEMIEQMRGKFFELMIAPKFSEPILERLKKRSAKMRVVRADKAPKLLEFTRAFNGYLVQTSDNIDESFDKWKIVSGSKLSKQLITDMEFAWKVCKHVKSNAVVIVKDQNMVGMGTGQPNRVNSTMLALHQAFGKPPQSANWSITKHPKTDGAVLASDAFFPFPDNVKLAARAGITAIVQPGGSINDEAVIKESKKHGITMVFTGVRHFKH